MFLQIFLLIFAAFVILTHLSALKACRILDRHGIRYIKPLPLFGNLLDLILRKKHLSDMLRHLYDAFPEDRYIAVFYAWFPAIYLRDVDLIRDVTSKNFDHFTDRALKLDKSFDHVAYTLPFLKGDEWTEMRRAITPVFNSNQTRLTVKLIDASAKQMVAYFQNILKEGIKGKILDINVSDLYRPYASDAVISTICNVEINSYVEQKNLYFSMGEEASKTNAIKLTIKLAFPKISKILDLTMVPRKVSSFFHDIVMNGMEERKRENVHGPDLVSRLSLIRKKWSDRELDLANQFWNFYMGGLEASASTAVWIAYILATKPKVQEKLRMEIDKTMANYGTDLSCEAIAQMNYLDMVIKESLRKWTNGLLVDRECTKDCTLPPPRDGIKETYTVKKGDFIAFSPYAIHFDPRHWNNPMEFIPERFSEENKDQIKEGSYIPFSLGRRGCVAVRYSTLLLKVWICRVLANFELVESSNSINTWKKDAWNINLKYLGGPRIVLKVRNF